MEKEDGREGSKEQADMIARLAARDMRGRQMDGSLARL
jgi:hypothetical protein